MSRKRIDLSALRSQRWFFGAEPVRPAQASRRIKQGGYSLEDFKDKPVIGILWTWSELKTCHALFPQRVEDVKRGVWQGGGFPVVVPVQSVSESFSRPTE